MKKKIAEWLRMAADKLTGEQTIDVAIAKQFEFEQSQPEISRNNDCCREREWVRNSILAGVRKATFEGLLRWEENITETEATIGARLRIISPIIIKSKTK